MIKKMENMPAVHVVEQRTTSPSLVTNILLFLSRVLLMFRGRNLMLFIDFINPEPSEWSGVISRKCRFTKIYEQIKLCKTVTRKCPTNRIRLNILFTE